MTFICLFVFEVESHSVAQAVLNLLAVLLLQPPSMEITGVSRHTAERKSEGNNHENTTFKNTIMK